MSEKGYYVSNKDMVEEIKKYNKTAVVSNELGKMFLHIANNFANKGNFAGYTWKEDMVGEAVYTCCRYVYNFDLKKSRTPNPFSYFTQVIYHSFLNYIKKQKKHSNIKDVCYNNADMLENEMYIEKGIDYSNLK